MNNDLISREALKEHKFVGDKFVQIGGRTNGKTLKSINKAYQQGWNDCIDAIIDNAPPVKTYCYFCGQTEHGQIEEKPQGERCENERRCRMNDGITSHDRFENLVNFLKEITDDYEFEDELTNFENAIQNTGKGNDAYFAIGYDHFLDFYYAPTGMGYFDRLGVKFLAQYYDGYQAPFTVCSWTSDIDSLIKLFKDTAPKLYEKYKHDCKRG